MYENGMRVSVIEFTWQPCDGPHSPEPGKRYVFDAGIEGEKGFILTLCPDCWEAYKKRTQVIDKSK